MDSESFMFYLLYVAVPILSFIWFLVNMIVFLTAPKKSKRREDFKALSLISGILFGVLLGILGTMAIIAAVAIHESGA